MKLFSREPKPKVEDDFDPVDLPTKDDLGDDFFVAEGLQTSDNEPEPDTRRPEYGIEQAIGLMRSLPRDNNELVVTVVNRTLRSMDIAVEDIIDSAERKEQRIHQQQLRLEQDVRELEEQIRQRNLDMDALMDDLRETVEVKKRLLYALEIEQELRAREEAEQAHLRQQQEAFEQRATDSSSQSTDEDQTSAE